MTFPLLRLPAELRREIWCLLLQRPFRSLPVSDEYRPDMSLRSFELLLVCRQIYDEAIEVLYSNIFHVTARDLNGAKINFCEYGHIKHVSLLLQFSDFYNYTRRPGSSQIYLDWLSKDHEKSYYNMPAFENMLLGLR